MLIAMIGDSPLAGERAVSNELLKYANQLKALVKSLDESELPIAAAHIATALDLVKRKLNSENTECRSEKNERRSNSMTK